MTSFIVVEYSHFSAQGKYYFTPQQLFIHFSYLLLCGLHVTRWENTLSIKIQRCCISSHNQYMFIYVEFTFICTLIPEIQFWYLRIFYQSNILTWCFYFILKSDCWELYTTLVLIKGFQLFEMSFIPINFKKCYYNY